MHLFHRGETNGSLWFYGKFYGMRFHRSALDQTALAAEEAIMAARTGTAQ